MGFDPFLAITNKAAMNIHVKVFVWTYALVKYLGIEWLEYMAGICSSFKEIAKLFSKGAVPSYITTRSA